MPELTTTQLVIIVVLGTVQLGLLLAGLITVARTPKEQLSAPRIVWILICFVQFVSPFVFFVAGRKRKTAAEPPHAAQTGPILDRVVAEHYPKADRCPPLRSPGSSSRSSSTARSAR